MHVPLTPIRALYRAVDLFGKKTGVVSGERRFTYAEFGERVERLAFGLLSEGVSPGDRVAFLSFNTNQLLEGYFGVPLIRAIVMPLNVRLTAAELTGILNHAEPRVVIYEADFAPVVEQLRAACPAVQRWIEIGPAYEELLARGRIQRPEIFTFDEREIAELFYTSGSTGTPKGVTLSHRTLYLHMLSVSATFYNDETDGGTAHHPALPRQRLGTAAVRHTPRPEAGDGAALRSGTGAAPDPGGEVRPRCRWCRPWPTRCSIARSSASSTFPA